MQFTNDCAGHRNVYCQEATKTLILEMCIFEIIRTINVPTVNSTKFLLCVDISMSSLALFFSNKLGNIRRDQTIFFSSKSISDQKIRDFHVSGRGAPRIQQRRGHNRECGGEAGEGDRFSYKKKHSV